uniref:Uncharacterized protein n=1 Tax=Anguilla anguilla TaxID=7936 RepID=A0A0E9QNM0_ANGAN
MKCQSAAVRTADPLASQLNKCFMESHEFKGKILAPTVEHQ